MLANARPPPSVKPYCLDRNAGDNADICGGIARAAKAPPTTEPVKGAISATTPVATDETSLAGRSFEIDNICPSDEIETVGVHDLIPGGNEVLHELLLGVGLAVDFRDGAQLRVRAEDQVDAGACPL